MAEPRSILNNPPQVSDGPKLLHKLIDFHRNQNACAIDFSGKDDNQKQYSYGEIQACVENLVSQIQKVLESRSEHNSTFSQHIIPILLPQSPSLYISQLAILESGGAFCPINLDAPEERIRFVAKDVSANLIITTAEFKNSVTWEGGPEIIIADEFPEPPRGHNISKGKRSREDQQDDIAYVMYTSGSSGTPKGVLVSHRAASQSLLAHEKHIPKFKRFLQFAAPSFDVSVFEIFFPLKRGATLVGCNRNKLLNDLPGMINILEVDAAELTPTVVGSLLQKRSNVPNLRLLLTIGEMLTRPIVEEFGGSDSKESILYGMYGPTEAAIHCTIHPNMKTSAKPGNIGFPLDTVSTFVAAAASATEVDGNLTFLPIGELGELVLGGPQLAQGYLNRPEQNKLAFLHIDNTDYYRTGDKARQLDDGTIEILGRMSAGQVKLRGQRVELGEIEEAVYKHSGIRTVAAAVLNGALIVFALVENHEITSEDVLKTCAKWLPKFMVPNEIILLHKFPYLPSGKVDKRALETDYHKKREDSQEADEEPENQAERVIKEILQSIFGPFPTTMRLAAAGLDSLVAIRISSKLRAFGYNITTLDVLQSDTVKSLANTCETSLTIQEATPESAQEVRNEDTMITLNGSAKDVEATISCSPLQFAMLSETYSKPDAYRNWIEIEVSGGHHTSHIISSLHGLATHNPILRSGFSESEDMSYVQVVWKALESSQFEEVHEFNYGPDNFEHLSLNRPIRFQIRNLGNSIKVLIHIHHALYDAWALELLLDDLNDLLAGKAPVSRPSFTKVIDGYEKGTLLPDSWATKDYWKDHLAGLDLRQLPNFHSVKVASESLAVTKLQTSISTSELETAARRLSSSPQSLFQAAYALLLSSYLGTSDICFGTVFSGRTLPIVGIEDIVGPCLSTLPIRVDISTSDVLQNLVQELNSTNRKHLQYSATPLVDIKSAAAVNSHQPLFDTLLIWQQTLHGYDHKRQHVSMVDSMDSLEFILTLEIIPGTGNIELKANYQESMLPKAQVEFLLQQLEQIAQLAISSPEMKLEDVFNQLGEHVLSVENQEPDVSPTSSTLSSSVERIAAADPDRLAIEFANSIDVSSLETERMSYFKLNSGANRMGHHLLAQNVLPDELVCICMEKCIELYVSILATAKVGAGYLPVTPDVPQDRLRYILDEAKVKVILARSESRLLLNPFTRLKIIYIDEVDFSHLSSENIPSSSSPSNFSYCVFTSGSTGTPKGVLVTQGNLLSNLDVLEEIYPTNKNPRLLQSCSQAFDVSVFEIFYTWRIGGCLCAATKDVLFRDIENAIRLLRVTHLSLTPTVAALVNPSNVPNVRFLVTAGEAVTEKVFRLWAEHGMYQGYGPSETTNICTVNPITSHDDPINNIGRPFKNTSAFVLSPTSDFSLLPRGGEGEFCFGGSQVFRGYLDKSQEFGKIIEHPKYGRLYRSGDFGRLLSDGSLSFTGRKDDQVKIRGQRVELGEVNAVMLESEIVRDCLTMVIDGTTAKSQRLVCFWTSPDSHDSAMRCLPPDGTALEQLYEALQVRLPSYMIPSALIPISLLPSTTQGKIDRKLLRKLYDDLDTRYLESVAWSPQTSDDRTWTDLELKIGTALAEVTGSILEDIGHDTSFFSLGIDSISAILLSRTLRKSTGFQVEISEILKHPSVVRLAAVLSSKSPNLTTSVQATENDFDFGLDKDSTDSAVNTFVQAGRNLQHILPCTPLQEAMLSAAEAPSSKMYNNHVVFKIEGNIDRLKKCWQEMVHRHQILRACFLRTDIPQIPYVQVILKDFQVEFGTVEDTANLAEAIAIIERRPTQAQHNPPYSLDIVRTPGATQLVVSMHHALYDGVALEVLYEEIEARYKGHSLPSAVSFAPFLHAMSSVDVVKSDLFWHNTMQNCYPSRLQGTIQQSDRIGPPTRIQRLSATYPLRQIDQKVKLHQTSLLSVCHAIWAGLIAELIQEADVCFGNVVSGRTIQIDGIERLVAPCFNTIPSRLQNTHKLSYLEAFRKLQSLHTDSLPFQLTPLRRIQSKFSPDGSRLFDTLFILQQPPRLLDTAIWSILEDDGAMDFPIVCEVVPRPDTDILEIILHSHSSVITPENAHALMVAFNTNLKTALDNPRRQLLSTSGKDRIVAKLLQRESAPSKAVESKRQKQPLTEREGQLRDVLANFTDIPIDKIGRDISIFRLGLDSISTVQVAARLRKIGYHVLASDILENPTIAKLDLFLHSDRDGSDQPSAAYDFESFDKKHRAEICSKYKLQTGQVDSIRPCTAVQQGMIAQSIYSHGSDYINSIWLELSPNISIPNLKAAWTAVVREHEILRTGFVNIDDPHHSFAMVTYSNNAFRIPWSEGDDELSVARILNRLAQNPWGIALQKKGKKTTLRFTAHHGLYDAQSLQIIFSDVANILNSASPSVPSFEPLLGAILLAGDDTDSNKDFWQRDENKIVVNRFPDLTPLQISSPQNLVREIFSTAFTSDLEALCKASGVTMQAVGQTSWARLLAAYTGGSSTTFGMTLSGRSIQEGADRIAFSSIVTLPVRCEVSGSNQDLLARTMAANASLHKHQFTPLTSIQKWAGYPDGRIFDSLFTYQKLHEVDADVELPWKVVREQASVDYAVSLEMQPENSGKMSLRLTFRDSLIPMEHAEIILRQFDALLQDTLRNPQSPCDIPPSLPDTLLSITPAKESLLPGTEKLLHEFVESGARRWPDKAALEFTTSFEVNTQSWSYTQLDGEANKIAHLLLKNGVMQGQMVGICFDKCPEASIAIVGILKSGCTYVALDPTAPIDRLRFIVEDSGAEVVLTAGVPAGKIHGELTAKVIALDEPQSLKDLSSRPPSLARQILPNDTAYCLYTSGTTGTPKGCLITHESVVQFMFFFQRLFAGRWKEDSKWLQFASFHFDVSLVEQFWSWSVGICVASAPRDLIFEDIPAAIRQLGITHIDLTPSLARLIHPDDVPSLWDGIFITGGEQLKQDILDVWGDVGCIHNSYGPTEATIGVTTYPQVPKHGKSSNIGPQFDNVGSFILKPGTEIPVLRGGVGELCVSGVLVGKGYLNRPDLTAEKFPTLKVFKERIYRTGDLVRILHDGCFLFQGRADDQVKLRGQRLELSEINEVIKKSSNLLDEVVTLVLKHTTQQKEQLVAFFVLPLPVENELQSLISTMRDACKSRLPGYMVPTHFIPIKALPLNVNNKADSKQLAAAYNNYSVEDLQQLSHSSSQDKPWSTKEQEVVQIISQALHVDPSSVNRETNIFELGLDSISIIGFSRALLDAGLRNAKLSIVKRTPNIDAMVQALLSEDSQRDDSENSRVVAAQNIAAFSQKHLVNICDELNVESVDIESIAPCTSVQEGMIYRFLESPHPLYFNKFDFRIDSSVSPERLSAAWTKVISGLQILRTKFVATGDGYSQVVLSLEKGDCRHKSINYNVADKTSSLLMPYQLKFDLSDPSNPSSGFHQSLQLFHGLYDGNSLEMMLNKVVEQCRGADESDYGPPFHSSLPYGPLAKVPGAENFWGNHLQGWSHQPMLEKSGTIDDIVASKNIVGIGKDLETFRKQLGVALQAMIQAVWLCVLQNILSSDLTIGIVTSGRVIDFEDADKVIGPLFNTVPFHVEIESGMTAASLINICHDFNMQMQDYQHTPLKDIQKWTSARPGQSLFDSLFVFQHTESREDFANGVWSQLEDTTTADYPLAFEASLKPNGDLNLLIVAQGSAISSKDARTLLDKMEASLVLTISEDGQNMLNSDDSIALSTVKVTKNTTTNGVRTPKTAAPPSMPFSWTKEAALIRSEISTLARISEETIQETSSIFELGLDSIDVIKLSSRLKRREVEIAVSTIIKCQTISNMIPELAKKVDRNNHAGESELTLQKMSEDIYENLKKNGELPPRAKVMPATPLQQSMVNEMISSGYKKYFNVELFKLENNTDEEVLRAAMNQVLATSPILRTSFIKIDDPLVPVSFVQIINEGHQMLDMARVNQDLEVFVEQFTARAIEYAADCGVLFHIGFTGAQKSRYMIMAISHALYDGTSLRLLHEDISRAYNGDLQARPDSRLYLAKVFESTKDDAIAFWKSSLSDLPPASFPLKEQTAETNNGATCRLERKSRITLHNTEKFSKSLGITFQTLGQTCWALVLSHLMQQLDVVFGTVLSGRDSEEATEVMFPLMNTVAVRSVVHGSLSEMLKYMQDMSDSTRQYQHFPLGTAQAYALASRKESFKDTKLFDTLFIYQGRRAPPPAQTLYEPIGGSAEVEFPVCVEMEIVEGSIVWTTACKSTARNPSETDGILLMLDDVLEHMLKHPNASTIVSDADGISVGGLPKFQKEIESRRNPTPPLTKQPNDKWSDTELEIRKALSKVSGVPEETIHKDLTIFHLGLDSILALKLPALLRLSGINLKVSDILKHQTIRAMAVSAESGTTGPAVSLDVDAVLQKATSSLDFQEELHELTKIGKEVDYIMPVTAGQLYMLRMWQTSQGVLFYPKFTYTIPGKVDYTKFNNAWKELKRRHSILRTGFIDIGTHVLQVVFKSSDESASPKTDMTSRNDIHKKEIDQQIPLFDIDLKEITTTSFTLELHIHHALYDGISLPILFNELESLYGLNSLAQPNLSFKSFVAQSLSTPSTQEKWKSYLTKESLYPCQTKHAFNNSIFKRRTEVYQKGRKISPLKELAKKFGVSIDSLLLAASAKILAQSLSNNSSSASPISQVVLGVYLANRAPIGEDLSLLAAPTLNLLPLCVEDPLQRPIPELALEIQRDLQDISSAEMFGASLADIFRWTGVRVNFFVNIHKDAVAEIKEAVGILGASQDISFKAGVVEESPDDTVVLPDDGRFDAYLPAIDLEMKYHGEEIDIGVFAPTSIISVAQAEELIEHFLEFWA